MGYEKFDIALLGGGAAASQVNHWVAEAIKDCMDPNKERDAVRKVSLEIKIACAADAESAGVSYRVIPKFPADSAGVDMVLISRTTHEAHINTDKQLPIDFDPTTGEVTEIRGAK
jgi:hypothetical protein